MAVGVGVGDGDRAGFAFFEAEDAEGFEEFVFFGFLALVEGEGLGAVGVLDGDGDVGGAVGVGDVGDGDAVLAGGGDVRGEGGGLGAFVFVAVVTVALMDVAGHGGSLGVEADEFGVVVIDDDAADLLFGEGGGFGDGRAFEVEHLVVGEEAGFELRVVDLLEGGVLFDGVYGGGGGALAEDHEDGFHADAAEGDVAGAEAGGGEEVGALGGFWADAAVADGVGAGADLDVALIADEAFSGDVALDVVGVHVVGAHADAVFDDFEAFAVLFGHDVVADHAADFADVELPGPVVIVEEFVFGEAECLVGFADVFGNAGVMGVGPEEAFLPVLVGLDDFCASGIVGFGVVPVHADEVGADGVFVVGVGFAVGHPGGGPLDAVVAGFDVAEGEFEPAFVVVGGFFPVLAIGGVVGGAHAEVVGLDFGVAGAIGHWGFGVDAGE